MAKCRDTGSVQKVVKNLSLSNSSIQSKLNRKIVGSYDCKCNSGYDGDGITCSDVNECLVRDLTQALEVFDKLDNSFKSLKNPQKTKCNNKATCTNTVGSYTCACTEGFFGNGQARLSKEKLEFFNEMVVDNLNSLHGSK